MWLSNCRAAALLAVTAALAGVPGQSGASTIGPIAHATCKHAVIGGKSTCIARGQFCTRRYQRQYLKYGLSCSKLDRNGRYHLR
jgi:hypothetical protein